MYFELPFHGSRIFFFCQTARIVEGHILNTWMSLPGTTLLSAVIRLRIQLMGNRCSIPGRGRDIPFTSRSPQLWGPSSSPSNRHDGIFPPGVKRQSSEADRSVRSSTDVNNIIVTWHYNPLWVFAFSAKSLQVLLSLAVSFQILLSAFLDLPWHPLAIVVLVFVLV